MLGGIDGDTSNAPTFRADLTPSRAWTGGRVTEPHSNNHTGSQARVFPYNLSALFQIAAH